MSEDELKARTEAAKARIAAVESKAAARAKAGELEEVEKLEQEAAEAEAIEEARAEYGEVDEGIKVVRHERGIVIVRRPEYLALKIFHDKGKFTVEAKDKLGRPCVVYPSREKYNELTKNNVGLISTVADAAAWLGGWGRSKLDEKPEA